MLVPGEGERGRGKSLQIVAGFATIGIRRSGKLRGVLVAMAIGAVLELDFIQRVFATKTLRNMTLCTLQRSMLPLQWISCRRMFFHSEG